MSWKINPFSHDLDYSPGPSSTVETGTDYEQSASIGSTLSYARSDHNHGTALKPIQENGIYINVDGVDPVLQLGYGSWILEAYGPMDLGGSVVTSSVYYPNSADPDHGITASDGRTMKDICNTIGVSSKATLHFQKGTYYVLTSLDLSSYSNIMFEFENGAVISVASTKTLTLPSPAAVIAQPNQQIFAGAGTVSFSNPGTRYPDWWGCDGTDDNVQITAAAASITGGKVKLLAKTYTVSISASITLLNGTTVEGEGYATRITSSGNRTVPIMDLDGVTDILVEKIRWDSGDDVISKGQIEISGNASDITIQNCHFSQGYAGIWIRPEAGDTVQRISILNNYLSDLKHNIYVGENTGILTETIKQLRIIGNHSRNAKTAGDGIKFIQSVYDCTVQGNVFEVNPADGIDLFASGDRITITGNVIEGNGVNGIDIKSDLTNYPAATWGSNKRIVISNNIIRGNTETGIKIWKVNAGEWPYGISVVGNEISENDCYGIACRGHYVNISNNIVFSNGLSSSTSYSGIYISGIATDVVDNITIANNHVFNNGETSQSSIGIAISSYSNRVTVSGNVIENDADIPNNFQKIGLYIDGTGCTEILVKNNKINGHATSDVSVDADADVVGDLYMIQVGTIAQASSPVEIPIYTAPCKTYILGSYLVNGADIASDVTDYVNFTVRDRGSDGSATNTICGQNTSDTGVSITAYDQVPLKDLSIIHATLAAGDVVTFVKSNGGAGKALTYPVVVLNTMTY